MKTKTVALLLAALMLFSMVACKSKEEAPRSIEIGETVTVGELAFKVTEFSLKDEVEGSLGIYVPGDNNIFAHITAEIVNNGMKEIDQYKFPSFTYNYDNGYDTHGLRGLWMYGKSTYIVERISPKSSNTYTFIKAMPIVQANDTSKDAWIDISFNGEKFRLAIR